MGNCVYNCILKYIVQCHNIIMKGYKLINKLMYSIIHRSCTKHAIQFFYILWREGSLSFHIILTGLLPVCRKWCITPRNTYGDAPRLFSLYSRPSCKKAYIIGKAMELESRTMQQYNSAAVTEEHFKMPVYRKFNKNRCKIDV